MLRDMIIQDELSPGARIPEAELCAQLGGTVTLLFSSKETKLNNASALKEYLESRE